MNEKVPLPSSFRDTAGFVFTKNGRIYRHINASYSHEYDKLMNGGLYRRLVGDKLLVEHEEVQDEELAAGAYRIIRPELIPFISYPYEWSFSQLKDAALLTLQTQKIAFQHGMVLRDASAYNVQFRGSRPELIDSLSFGLHEEGKPWTAYRQFCQHFLAPLALASARGPQMLRLLQSHIDGLPLTMVADLIPAKYWFNPSLLMHLRLHANMQTNLSPKATELKQKQAPTFSTAAFTGLIDNLEYGIKSLNEPPVAPGWSGYQTDHNYTDTAMRFKRETVERFVRAISPRQVWDIGSNTGDFSRICAQTGAYTISVDGDPFCVDTNYKKCRQANQMILPLVVDLSSPSPAIGWANQERLSLIDRGPADLGVALALIHHLCIGNNVSLPMLSEFFAKLFRNTIVEFVPKDDSQVERMLAFREDIFSNYKQEEFERAFSSRFDIVEKVAVPESKRWLYLMSARS